jgi:hypothetical protein
VLQLTLTGRTNFYLTPKISRVPPGYLSTLKPNLLVISDQSRFKVVMKTPAPLAIFKTCLKRVNFGTDSSVPPKVNFGAELW